MDRFDHKQFQIMRTYKSYLGLVLNNNKYQITRSNTVL